MSGKRATAEQKAKMVEWYLGGKSAEEAGGVFGFDKSTCLRAVREAGESTRSVAVAQRHRRAVRDGITEEMREQMVTRYLSGLSVEAAVEPFGVSQIVLQAELKRRNIKPRGKTEYRRRTLDKRCFASIDTEEKAYWLGFIAADGNVNKKCNRLSFTLGRVDREHLVKFAAFLKSDAKIRDWQHEHWGKMNLYSALEIHSVEMAADLVALGITPAKSATVTPWVGPEHLMRHYWRGAVDGDGSIFKMRANRGWGVSLVGTLKMVSEFAAFAGSASGSRATARRLKGFVHIVLYGGMAMPAKVAAALYDDANVFLDRKMELAKELRSDAALTKRERRSRFLTQSSGS